MIRKFSVKKDDRPSRVQTPEMGILDPQRIILDLSGQSEENSDDSSIDLQTKNLARFPLRSLPKKINPKIYEKINFFDFPYTLLSIEMETDNYEIR